MSFSFFPLYCIIEQNNGKHEARIHYLTGKENRTRKTAKEEEKEKKEKLKLL
jgi:hypothetical protein